MKVPTISCYRRLKCTVSAAITFARGWQRQMPHPKVCFTELEGSPALPFRITLFTTDSPRGSDCMPSNSLSSCKIQSQIKKGSPIPLLHPLKPQICLYNRMKGKVGYDIACPSGRPTQVWVCDWLWTSSTTDTTNCKNKQTTVWDIGTVLGCVMSDNVAVQVKLPNHIEWLLKRSLNVSNL